MVPGRSEGSKPAASDGKEAGRRKLKAPQLPKQQAPNRMSWEMKGNEFCCAVILPSLCVASEAGARKRSWPSAGKAAARIDAGGRIASASET